VSKRRDGPYRSGRGMDWLKAKCRLEQEFVIVGWSDPEGSRAGFGSLLLAVQGPEGLVYAGRVGTGFDDAMLRRLHRELESLPRPIAPVKNAPRSRRFHWVEPRRVAQVSFSNWTRDNLLRHPVFLGLREDKHPSEIAREIPRKL
ncbi:MAG TPA: ATP-dependent DNA ligase, partial [Planctomycetota bacterium]|nr:ATP-dependent DNA ligase [Planctomycetota bacterium]